jgi:hypothetical protein
MQRMADILTMEQDTHTEEDINKILTFDLRILKQDKEGWLQKLKFRQ